MSAQRSFAVGSFAPTGRSVSAMLSSDDADARADVVATLGYA
jgi:hypothetical protein